MEPLLLLFHTIGGSAGGSLADLGITRAGISEAANIVTSIPFVLAAAAGLAQFGRQGENAGLARGASLWLRDLPTLGFVLSLAMVGAGSMIYHWRPTPEHLLWDRLPIAFSLAAFACALVNLHSGALGDRAGGQRRALRARERGVWGSALLAPVLLVSVGAVCYWYVTLRRGHEDLLPWATVQVAALAWAALVALTRGTHQPGTVALRWALVLYAGGRIFELLERPIYDRVGVDVGHPLKHLLVAGAAFLMLRALAEAARERAHSSRTAGLVPAHEQAAVATRLNVDTQPAHTSGMMLAQEGQEIKQWAPERQIIERIP